MLFSTDNNVVQNKQAKKVKRLEEKQNQSPTQYFFTSQTVNYLKAQTDHIKQLSHIVISDLVTKLPCRTRSKGHMLKAGLCARDKLCPFTFVTDS